MTIHESEADERTYEKALAEENAHGDQDFGCRANYSVRCASGWMAHCISVGMEDKPDATIVRSNDTGKGRRDSQGSARYRRYHCGRNIGPDGRPKYTPMSGGIRNGTREHSRHVLGVA